MLTADQLQRSLPQANLSLSLTPHENINFPSLTVALEIQSKNPNNFSPVNLSPKNKYNPDVAQLLTL
jgi:hypothetical protein